MEIYDEIAERVPRSFSLYPTQKARAVRLFCIECMGGSAKDAIECQTKRCFLWPHRGAAWNESAVTSGARPADWHQTLANDVGNVLAAANARSAALKASTPPKDPNA